MDILSEHMNVPRVHLDRVSIDPSAIQAVSSGCPPLPHNALGMGERCFEGGHVLSSGCSAFR